MNRLKPFNLIYLCTLPLLLALQQSVPAATVKCRVTRDVGVAALRKERNFNMGRSPRLKLKFIHEFVLVDFDVSGLKGKRIAEAYLFVKAAGGHEWGLNGGTDLRLLTISTVGHDWVEGKSETYAKDKTGHGATFSESSYRKADWGWPGARLHNVVLGHGNTIRSDANLVPHKGWHRVKLDPRLIRALVAKATHGLFLMDGSGDYMLNCRMYSRESKNMGPYLQVVTSGIDAIPPGRPVDLRVRPAPNWATPKLGAVMVSLTVPRDAFAYRLKVNGKAVDRWQIPFAAEPGTPQQFPILDLPADQAVTVQIQAVDTAGNVSAAAVARGRTGPKLTVPSLPKGDFRPGGGEPKKLAAAQIWAFPEVTKVDPVSGKVLHEPGVGDYRRKNPVWDGANGTIRLAAAKGEIVSFQIAAEGKAKGVSVAVSDLRGPGTISSKGVRLWRNWYVENQSEYAIPLVGSFDCPMPDNAIKNQKLQAVTVDCHIPLSTKPGIYDGRVTISAGAARVTLPLKVRVYDVTIPENIFFNPELNCYGGPGRAGSKRFKDFFRLAHFHRCTINRVPYSHTGHTDTDWRPKTDKSGRIVDWSEYDKNLGGLFDGSWFKDNPRSGVPVPCLYMPHHEAWPIDFRKHYDAGCPIESGDKEKMTRHNIRAKPIEEAIDAEYRSRFVANVREFYEHARKKGWTRTCFQMFQNSKSWKGGYTLWTLDEPYKSADWMALNFWGRLWKQGINDPEVYTRKWHEEYFRKGLAGMKRDRPTFLYRGDISRPQWQGSVADGIMTIIYGGGDLRMMRFHRLRMPAILCTYGACSNHTDNNWKTVAWCVKSYAAYYDGVLPWQALGHVEALKEGDKPRWGNALIIDTGGKFGEAIASFRVHALRRGAQDCELLRLLQLKRGWSREHIGLLLAQKIPLGRQHQVTDEAAAVEFGQMDAGSFCELKEGILKLLTE